jgi:hypothetical protein
MAGDGSLVSMTTYKLSNYPTYIGTKPLSVSDFNTLQALNIVYILNTCDPDENILLGQGTFGLPSDFGINAYLFNPTLDNGLHDAGKFTWMKACAMWLRQILTDVNAIIYHHDYFGTSRAPSTAYLELRIRGAIPSDAIYAITTGDPTAVITYASDAEAVLAAGF